MSKINLLSLKLNKSGKCSITGKYWILIKFSMEDETRTIPPLHLHFQSLSRPVSGCPPQVSRWSSQWTFPQLPADVETTVACCAVWLSLKEREGWGMGRSTDAEWVCCRAVRAEFIWFSELTIGNWVKRWFIVAARVMVNVMCCTLCKEIGKLVC